MLDKLTVQGLLDEGLTTYELSDRLSVPRSTLQRFMSKNGLSTGRRPGPRPGSRSKKTRAPCPVCGEPSKTNAVTCGRTCAVKQKRDDFISRWLRGEAGLSGIVLSRWIRHYLIEKAGHRCQKCGWGEVNPKTGKIPLTINHIDGDPFRHVPSNLEVLCPSCHSLTPNYGGSNKGNGRLSRKRAGSNGV